jgi:hypothetical protein
VPKYSSAPTSTKKISSLDRYQSSLGENAMSKSPKSNKEDKKKPAHTQKEKKAIKKSKEDSNNSSGGLLTGK